MRNHRTAAPTLEIVSIRGGYIVRFVRGRRTEYLGADKLWHGHPLHADPFPLREDAEAAMERQKEER